MIPQGGARWTCEHSCGCESRVVIDGAGLETERATWVCETHFEEFREDLERKLALAKRELSDATNYSEELHAPTLFPTQLP